MLLRVPLKARVGLKFQLLLLFETGKFYRGSFVLTKLLIISFIRLGYYYIIASMYGWSPRYTINTTPLGITLNVCSTALSTRECKRRTRQVPWISTTINPAAGKVEQCPANRMECFTHIPKALKRCQLWNPAVAKAGTGRTSFPLNMQ